MRRQKRRTLPEVFTITLHLTLPSKQCLQGHYCSQPHSLTPYIDFTRTQHCLEELATRRIPRTSSRQPHKSGTCLGGPVRGRTLLPLASYPWPVSGREIEDTHWLDLTAFVQVSGTHTHMHTHTLVHVHVHVHVHTCTTHVIGM